MKLNVSEVFYSIQGEGRTTGTPAVFVRLGGCNLLCKSASWICDTIEVWKKSRATLFNDILTPEQLRRLREGAHLVITGGEPLLQQENVLQYIYWLRREVGNLFIEIETNGTILPFEALFRTVNQWNCSPKLPNSGEPWNKRVNEIALSAISKQACAQFKFVIQHESDIVDILGEFSSYIKNNQIVLMPAGATQEELSITRPLVVEVSKKYGMKFTDRMHITLWNKKTGV